MVRLTFSPKNLDGIAVPGRNIDEDASINRARSVTLDAVSVAAGVDAGALSNVTIHVDAGARVALVGLRGDGVSRVGALVSGTCDPDSGKILIDGRPASEYPLPWLRDQVAVVSVGTDDVADPQTRRIGAVRRLSARGQLAPTGDGLRSGQRLRASIARARLRDASILIVEEPLGGLDAESEAEVMAALDLVSLDHTMLILARSIALALAADRVVVIDRGRVVESGTPSELLSRDTAFAKLANRDGRRTSREWRSVAGTDRR
jgi:ABC-type multidrug transport system fused ATPase/permease subunit